MDDDDDVLPTRFNPVVWNERVGNTMSTMATDREPGTAPQYVHELMTGAEPADDLILDAETLRDLAQQVLEIEEARAAAAVSGRDYLVCH